MLGVIALAVCLLPWQLSAQAKRAAEVPAETLLSIQSLIERGDLDTARNLSQTIARQHPRDGGLENLQGVIAAQMQNPKEAVQYFEHAVRDRPNLVPAYLNLARVYLEFPREFPQAEEKAAALYRRAISLDTQSEEARLQLAAIDERHQRFGDAMVQLEALPRERTSMLLLVLRCSAAAATGKQEMASADAVALASDPELQGGDVISMAEGLRAGRRADLIEDLLRAVQGRQPLSAEELRMLGLAQDAEGKTQEASTSLEQAYALNPKSSATLLDLARMAERRGDDTAALGYLAHAREVTPEDASLAFAFGEVCVRLKLLGEARNAMERAVELEPENAQYNLDLGKVTALSQDPLRAVPYLKRYHALRQSDPEGTLLLGVVYYRVKDFAGAEPWLRQASASNQTAADAHLYLGSGFRQMNEPERARLELEESVRLNDKEPETHAELGLLALQAKDTAAASRELQRALTLEPENYTANFGLLQLYAQTGDPRRKEQLARFEKIKDANDTLNRQAMRVIEVSR